MAARSVARVHMPNPAARQREPARAPSRTDGHREGSVQKHVASIFATLGLPAGVADDRRVRSVLACLRW
jgi:hypothetical protein